MPSFTQTTLFAAQNFLILPKFFLSPPENLVFHNYFLFATQKILILEIGGSCALVPAGMAMVLTSSNAICIHYTLSLNCRPRRRGRLTKLVLQSKFFFVIIDFSLFCVKFILKNNKAEKRSLLKESGTHNKPIFMSLLIAFDILKPGF